MKPKVRFQRANFLVADIDRALSFYQGVLGFELVFIKDSAEDSYSYDVFEIARGTPMRFAVLKTETQANVMALTEAKDLPKTEAMPRRAGIVLDVSDIDEVISKSQALGLKTYHEDHLITKDCREGREYGIVDYDGNLVVVYTITKAAP